MFSYHLLQLRYDRVYIIRFIMYLYMKLTKNILKISCRRCNSFSFIIEDKHGNHKKVRFVDGSWFAKSVNIAFLIFIIITVKLSIN